MNNHTMAQPPVSANVLPALPINRFRTADIDEHARNMGGWQVSYDQLTPGRFEGELIELRCDWMQLVRDRSNQALTKRGIAWEGAITFSVPLSADGPVFCSGHPIVDPSLLVARGHNLPELRTPQHLDLLGVAIEEQALAHVLERQGSRFRITDLPKCYRLGDSTLPAELAALFDELDGGEQGRESLLGYESIRRGLRDTVMLHVLELVAPDEAPPLNPTARKRMVDRAREYALAHVDEPLSILDLCNHIGASRRKLQYCFQETLGINPVAYLRALRLNAVRRELRNGDQPLGVQEVAARWGFWHLSRFSSDYRILFGETPSQTLRRTHLC
ncbi:AraC family transcriptional regulator [Pseudomonas brassicacearum]|uniref:helix-turn-helix domain-containing protein n=1 Tax=Pseudomonas brassicacearum TaxID=930166 RepID=UPI00042F05A6|nr:helix-turn-helix domain-containing protein [Pseudomonas brassicacearum]AHL33814.1 AraC family transcriptional regulator [Pseudomonas brassicacearum]